MWAVVMIFVLAGSESLMLMLLPPYVSFSNILISRE